MKCPLGKFEYFWLKGPTGVFDPRGGQQASDAARHSRPFTQHERVHLRLQSHTQLVGRGSTARRCRPGRRTVRRPGNNTTLSISLTNKPAVWQICILQPLLIKKDTALSTRFFSNYKINYWKASIAGPFVLKLIVIYFVNLLIKKIQLSCIPKLMEIVWMTT